MDAIASMHGLFDLHNAIRGHACLLNILCDSRVKIVVLILLDHDIWVCMHNEMNLYV